MGHQPKAQKCLSGGKERRIENVSEGCLQVVKQRGSRKKSTTQKKKNKEIQEMVKTNFIDYCVYQDILIFIIWKEIRMVALISLMNFYRHSEWL